MNRSILLRLGTAVVLGSCAFAKGGIAQVNFNSLPVGAAFGGSVGQSPGQPVPSLGQDGIAVTVENFRIGSSTLFFKTDVHAANTDSFATRHMWLDNISLGFNFASVGFPVSQVTIEYHEFGGADNFSVNGSPVVELPALTSIPLNIAPGVTATADADSITLNGPISRFLIGGQELAIDNIVATPEPTCLAFLGLGGLAALRRARNSGLRQSR